MRPCDCAAVKAAAWPGSPLTAEEQAAHYPWCGRNESAGPPLPRGAEVICAQCGMDVQPSNAYHSYLCCEIFKRLGHRDPLAYLASYGFVRTEEPK